MNQVITEIQQHFEKLRQQGKSDQAMNECRDLCLFSIHQTASLLFKYQEIDSAIHWLRNLIALRERLKMAGPDHALAYANLGVLLSQQARLHEALQVSQKAVDTDSLLFEVHYTHADILYAARRFDEAISAYRKAIELNPGYPLLHFNLADCLLRTGQYLEGWKEYEWRMLALPHYADFRQKYNKPTWNGKDDLTGKTILVTNEQGIGDAVQYCRYLPELKKKGCKIILEVQKDIANFLQQLDVDQVVARSKTTVLPDYDYLTFFCSFPYLFDPELTKIPSADGYLKVQEPEKIPDAFWSKYPCKLRIGICWAGNEAFHLDHLRSSRLKNFLPLAKIPGVRLFNLQKGNMIRPWSGDLMADSEGIDLVDVSAYMNDFNDTANLINHLDLIISVDTAIIHLAGAMGKPVWVLISKELHDRRFQDYEATTPWYKSMRAFQQTKLGDWSDVFEEVVKQVKELV